MVFVDVGANMGLYTLFAARKVGEQGQVLAIEPSSRECERLLRNLQANSVSNVRLVRKAVSDSSAEAELLVAADVRSGHNTLGAFSYDTPLAIKEKVRTERLDAIVAEEGLARVDVIKMDVEGAEVRALEGAVESPGAISSAAADRICRSGPWPPRRQQRPDLGFSGTAPLSHLRIRCAYRSARAGAAKGRVRRRKPDRRPGFLHAR